MLLESKTAISVAEKGIEGAFSFLILVSVKIVKEEPGAAGR